MTAYPSFISGLEPERVDANTLRVFKGSIANGEPNPAQTIDFNAAEWIDVAMTRVGKNGRDAGSIVDNTCWHAYAFKDPSGNDANNCFVLSRSGSYGGVTVPAGYDIGLCAKLPYSLIYRQSVGFPAFHVHGGKFATFEFTDWPLSAQEVVNLATGNPVYQTVQISAFAAADPKYWVPDSARMVELHAVLEGITSAGYLYLQSAAGASGDQPVAYVDAGSKTVARHWLRLTSDGKFKWKTSGTGQRVTLRPVAYRDE